MSIPLAMNHLEKQEIWPDKYGKARCKSLL